ncbi:hypothetical protein K439DRAFT_1641189 [Ramaria rubella]|nr:hypothetical protein K439DRAFT_1641189 [Ramaria rubella]
MGLVETGLESFVGYTYLVGSWGDTNILFAPPKPLLFQLNLSPTPTVGYLVQSFYIWKIWAFGRNVATKCICVFLAAEFDVLRLWPCSVSSWASTSKRYCYRLLVHVNIIAQIWLVSAAVVDIIISISMIIIVSPSALLRHTSTLTLWSKQAAKCQIKDLLF